MYVMYKSISFRTYETCDYLNYAVLRRRRRVTVKPRALVAGGSIIDKTVHARRFCIRPNSTRVHVALSNDVFFFFVHIFVTIKNAVRG